MIGFARGSGGSPQIINNKLNLFKKKTLVYLMEFLTQCSKVLYDKDICDKMEQIQKLKKKIKKGNISIPKKLYSTYEEWYVNKEKAFEIIKNGITQMVIEDNFEYEHMSYQGITTRQSTTLPYYIKEALELLTNDSVWSENKSFEILRNINDSFQSFIELELWENIYSQIEADKMAKLIYKNIELKIGDNCGLIYEISTFKCRNCNEVYSMEQFPNIEDDNYICYDCSSFNSENEESSSENDEVAASVAEAANFVIEKNEKKTLALAEFSEAHRKLIQIENEDISYFSQEKLNLHYQKKKIIQQKYDTAYNTLYGNSESDKDESEDDDDY
jgi:hypothetical protein